MFKENYITNLTFPVRLGVMITPDMSFIDNGDSLSIEDWIKNHENGLREKVAERYLPFLKSKEGEIKKELRKKYKCFFEIIDFYIETTPPLAVEDDGLSVDYYVKVEIETNILFADELEIQGFIKELSRIIQDKNYDASPDFSFPEGDGKAYWIEELLPLSSDIFENVKMLVYYRPEFLIADSEEQKLDDVKLILDNKLSPVTFFYTPCYNKKNNMDIKGYKVTYISREEEKVLYFANKKGVIGYINELKSKYFGIATINEKAILKDCCYLDIKTDTDEIEVFVETVDVSLNKPFK